MAKSAYTKSGRARMGQAPSAPPADNAAPPAPEIPEHERAKAWRKAMKLTRDELSAATGYSVRAIQEYESGRRSSGRAIEPGDWRTYRLACAAIAGGVEFDWTSVRVAIGDVEVTRRVHGD